MKKRQKPLRKILFSYYSWAIMAVVLALCAALMLYFVTVQARQTAVQSAEKPVRFH